MQDVITTATPMLPTGLGFNPFKAAAGLVKKSITVPTKLLVRAAHDPNVQHAAVAAGETYAQQNYAQQIATGQQYAAKARSILHPQGPDGPPAPGDMAPDGGGGGGPSGAGNSHFLLYGLIGAGVIAALLVMKK